ncbi:DMT family transporter [Halomonas korlensis]|uniref:Permease of the drug/metabolite transporter (DMT) superfamily n=1 Tax=Halomonas korlensis TaxID=463301 RepID=A0A1I7K718_9GAMM|nr:DMT family transporter [Halomonas korlensis]SFU93224.1 Permease of the drug/metabolite transporter (DMT) superfamily [Halomonas korlensis]
MLSVNRQFFYPVLRLHLRPLGGLAVALGFVICWSSGFVGSRLGVELDTPALALYAWRFALATLLVGGWWCLRAQRQGRQAVAPRDLAVDALVGSLTVGGYLLAMLLAIEQGVSAGLASLIGALQPLAAIALAGWWLGERSRPLQWLGMLVATLGAGLSVLDDMQGVGGAPAWSYGLPILAVVTVTLGSVMAARRPTTLPLEARLTAQLGAATVVFFAAAWGLDEGRVAPPPLTTDSVMVLVWLIVLATFGGYGFFNASLQRFGVGRSAALIALTPAATLGWTALMFGELPGWLGMIGMALGLLGAIGALLAGRRPTQPGQGTATVARSVRPHVGRSGPRRRAPAVRHAPRTW